MNRRRLINSTKAVYFLFCLYLCMGVALFFFMEEHFFNISTLNESTEGSLMILVLYVLIQMPMIYFIFILAKKSEKDAALIEENHRAFEALFYNNLNIFFKLDPNGNITAINDMVKKVLGYSPEEAIGKNITEWFSIEGQPTPGRWLGPQKEMRSEIQARHKEGTVASLLLLVVPVKKQDGSISGYIGAVRDVTNEKKYAAELKQLSDRYQALFKLHPHFSCLLNSNGIIIEINEKVKEVLGEALVGQHFMDIIYEREKSFALEGFERVLRGKIVENFDIVKDKKGSPIQVEYKSIPIIENENVKGVFLVAKDITDIKQLKEIIAKDVKVATIVQQSVLSTPIKQDDIHIVGHYVPAHNIGGDMYAWHPIDSHRYGVMILDVMGHGVSAALVSMSIHSLLEGMMIKLQDPSKVMKELNRHMYHLFNENDHSLRYFTAVYLVIDTKEKTIEYINAGHVPGVLINGQDSYYFESECVPIGLMREIEPKALKITYEGSAQIYLYTDGLLEHLNKQSIRNAVQKAEERFRKESDLDIVEYVNSSILQSGFDQQDDVSIVSIHLP